MVVVLLFLLATMGCADFYSARKIPVAKAAKVDQSGQPGVARTVHGSGGKTGNIREVPYRVYDKTYYPLKTARNFIEEGIASWYGADFHGQLTSSKEVYDMNSMTAAHKTLPFNTRVNVLNLENGLEAIVRINDRGPFVNDRIIDLSWRAANVLGMMRQGTARVRLTVVDPGGAAGGNAGEVAPESYSVQIGVFKDMANADRLQRQFDDGRTERYEQRGGRFYRVLVGNHPDFEQALKRLDDLRANGYPKAFVVAGK
jgi:rare lipoprotein A